MARSAIQLQEEENYYFHLNYQYMWKKLNTAPYYVSGSGEMPSWIKDPWLLPSYVNLSRCMNPEYVPSMNIVNKIIQFYNANIQPAVDSYQFLHDKLEMTNAIRSTGSSKETDEFCGLYRCYYYAGLRNKKAVYGALLRISKVHDETFAQMITGLPTDLDLHNPALLQLFDKPDIPIAKYQAYVDGLDLAKRQTALFKGVVELTPGVLNAQMQSIDREGTFVSFRCSTNTSYGNRFLGNLGLAAMISKQGIMIFKLGVLKEDVRGIKPMSLDDAEVSRLLDINKLPNEHISLTMHEATEWQDLIISSQNQSI